MDNVRISEQAKIQAQRILNGENVSEHEMRSVLASVVLSVCEVKSRLKKIEEWVAGGRGALSPRQEVVVRVAPWAAAVVVVVAVCYAVVSHSLVRAGHGERVADNLKEAVHSVKKKGD